MTAPLDTPTRPDDLDDVAPATGAVVLRGAAAYRTLRTLRLDPVVGMEALVAEHGDAVELRFAGQVFLLLAHPDAVEQVLKPANAERMHKGRALKRAKRIFGDGLLTSEGAHYLRQRRLAQPAFRPRGIDGYAEPMARHVTELLAGVRPGEVVDVEELMNALTLRIAGETMFGVDLDGREAEVSEALGLLRSTFSASLHPLAPIRERLPTPSTRRFERARAVLADTVDWIIAERRADPDAHTRTDLLSLLLGARDEDGTGMSDEELRDEALVLLLAGHETTANALGWALYRLAGAPEARARLEAEVDDVVGSGAGARVPTADDVRRMPWTAAVLSETLRLYPAGPGLTRCTLDGMRLEWTGDDGAPRVVDAAPSTELLIAQWVVQRDARWFGVDAAEFRPERMLDDAAPDRHRFAWMAFGGGRRVCIGRAFAMLEGVLVLAMLAQHLRFRLPDGAAAPGDSLVEAQFTLRPRGGMPLVPELR